METLLNLVIFLPLLGAALIWLLPAGRGSRALDTTPHDSTSLETGPHGAHDPAVEPPGLPRTIAALVSGITLLLALVLFANFDRTRSGFQFETNEPWIPLIGVNYHVGVDGISLPLVVLNALLTFLAVLVSWNLAVRPKAYFALVLVLETAVAGVFSALDFFLFFLFWELALGPIFLLIGVWGGPRREYAALQSLMYTVVGAPFMLVGTLALYFLAGRSTFGRVRLGA